MHKHLVLILIIIEFSASFLSSCALIGKQTSTQIGPREEWIANWLERPECQIPCWEGITPGTSTMTETINILKTMDNLYIYGPKKKDIGEGTYIAWEYPDSLSTGGAETFSNDGIVQQLYLYIDQTRQDLNLSDVFDVYGYPDYVLPLRYHDYTYQVDLIYKKGFLLNLLLPAKNERFEVLPDSIVGSISFFTNGINGYENLLGDIHPDLSISLKPWDGYTKYNYP